MPLQRVFDALARLGGGRGLARELAARTAYLDGRRQDLAKEPGSVDAETLVELDDRLKLIRLDLAAGRRDDAAAALNELDEHLAALEQAAFDAEQERTAHQARVERLRRNIAGSRARLVGLRLVGIGSDGLAMLEARLVRAERTTTPAAIAAAEAEAQAVERALDRLTERAGSRGVIN